MNFFKNNPFVRIVIFWLAGILLSKYFVHAIYLLIAAATVLLISSLLLFKKRHYPFDFVSSLFIGSILCLFAFSFSTIPSNPILPETYTGHLKIVLLETPVEKTNSIQLNIKILQADSSVLHHTKAVFYTRKLSTIKNLKAGNQLLCKTMLQKIKNHGNPFEFDYSAYMERQGYFYSAFLNTDDIQILDIVKRSPLYLAENFRNKLLKILNENIENQEALQVISALTLGYRKELSSEIKTRFAATGAMHVLAVSGLHVGMIFLFLSQLFFFIKRKRMGRWIFVFLIAGILWSYALITGFSPSVQRATVMFSIILIGTSLKRPTSIYNSLAASAFLLLLFNPNLLFEVGFQLSYMAVLSIVFFYPRLEKLAQPNYWLPQKSWQLICVSTAAQIGTFPLSIFYFNQFPTYFLLSNFIVIPAAYLILGFTFALLITSPIKIVTTFFASLLENTTEFTIYILAKIEKLPFSLIEKISISNIQLLSLILIFISSIFFIKWKRKIYLFLSMSSIVFFLSVGLIEKYKLFNQKKIIVYNNTKTTIHLINNRNNYILYFGEDKPSDYLFKNTRNKLQLNNPTPIPLAQIDSINKVDLLINNGIIQFLNQKLIIRQEAETNQAQNLFYNYTKIERKESKHFPSILFLENSADNIVTVQKHLLNKRGAFIVDF